MKKVVVNDKNQDGVCQVRNDFSIDEIDMPDMDIVLQKFGIDSSKFKKVSLKKYEKEMFLTTISIDNGESPTIS